MIIIYILHRLYGIFFSGFFFNFVFFMTLYRNSLSGPEAWKYSTSEGWTYCLEWLWFVILDILQTTSITLSSCSKKSYVSYLTYLFSFWLPTYGSLLFITPTTSYLLYKCLNSGRAIFPFFILFPIFLIYVFGSYLSLHLLLR
jgi:hypothetical protein